MAGQEIWDLWFPDAGAQGLPFARGRMDQADVVLALVESAAIQPVRAHGCAPARGWRG
ncbi:MAG: hypothetical protein HYX51_07795 [Chloroflexi bacterium]|nr:hypothetical protein [Chloroflexota bacterium]